MKIAFFGVTEEDEAQFKDAFPGQSVELIPEIISEDFLPYNRDLDILSITTRSRITRAVLDQLPNVRLITTRSTGVDHIDLDACAQRDIPVKNVPAYGANTVAEFTFALILALSRRVFGSYNQVRQTGSFDVAPWRGFDLAGKTIGVVGTGNIGAHVIQLANGFGMRIFAYDVKPDAKLEEHYPISYMSLEELLGKSDIVTLHVPYIPDATHHLLNKDTLAKAKKGAIIINTARGELIDTEALVQALRNGHLGGAGLDVLEEEYFMRRPHELMLDGHPNMEILKHYLYNNYLIEAENVIVTPHNAFNTTEALQRIRQQTIDTINQFIDNEP